MDIDTPGMIPGRMAPLPLEDDEEAEVEVEETDAAVVAGFLKLELEHVQ